MVRWIDGTMDRWHNGMMQWHDCTMTWWYDGMNDNGRIVQWLDGTMAQWWRQQVWRQGKMITLFFWHKNQPCGQMHSCQRGEEGVFNDDKNKDGEDNDDKKLQRRQWTTTTNDDNKLQWPTPTTHNDDQQQHDYDQHRQRNIKRTMQQSTSQRWLKQAMNVNDGNDKGDKH